VEPASLFTGRSENFAQRVAEAQRTVPYDKIRGMAQTAPLEKQLTAALGAFAIPIAEANGFLATPFIGADQHQVTFFSAIRGRK